MSAKSSKPADPARLKMQQLFAASGMTFQQLGERMWPYQGNQRQLAWRCLNTDRELSVDILRRFAIAMEIAPSRLLVGS